MAKRHRKEVSLYLAAGAAFVWGLIPALPDTNVGSPRAIATGIAGGLTAAAVLLRGSDAKAPA